MPDSFSATAVGFGFLAVSYRLVLRHDDSAFIARHGLAFGGLFEHEPLSLARMTRECARAVLWASAMAALLWPPLIL